VSPLPYGATVLEHFRRPRRQRSLAQPTVVKEAANPLCGDRVRVELEIVGGTIVDAGFTANACAICTASSSLLMERVSGMAASAAQALTDQEVVDALESDVPAARVGCAVLPLRALHDGLIEVAKRT